MSFAFPTGTARHGTAAVAAALLLLGVAVASEPERLDLTLETQGGGTTLQVERAVTPAERARGLMFRRSMRRDHGMLFDFGGDRPVSMWMKNTYIPLDMIFIGSDRRVKHVARRTTPFSERTVSSPIPVRYVLEVNAGVSDELEVAPGDLVSGPAIEDAR